MNCRNCGKSATSDANFCAHCGAPVTTSRDLEQGAKKKWGFRKTDTHYEITLAGNTTALPKEQTDRIVKVAAAAVTTAVQARTKRRGKR